MYVMWWAQRARRTKKKGMREVERAKQSRFLSVFVFMEIIYLVIYFGYGLCMEAIKLQEYFFMDFLAINML